MQNNFDVKLDVETMSLEELEAAQKVVRELMSKIKFQIVMKKMAAHKYSSSQEAPTI